MVSVKTVNTPPTTSAMPGARTATDPLVRNEPVAPRARRAEPWFRLPAADDAEPDSSRLLGITLWAAGLGLAGLIPGGSLLMAMVFGEAATWYTAVSICIGLIGMTAVALAFAAVHRRDLPYPLLGASSICLVINLMLMLLH